MFIVVIATCLLTVIILILTSAFYLISLIAEESDDHEYVDSLSLHADSFSTSPADTLSYRELVCEDPSHHHQCIGESKSDYQIEAQASDLEPVDSNEEDREDDSTLSDSKQAGVSQVFDASFQENISLKELNQTPWSDLTQAQKNTVASQLGVPASRQMFDEFDQKEMALGGCGLHWCKTRRVLDRLIKLGVPLNTINNNGETALHVAVRKRKLPLIIGLVCYGADTNCRNRKGETPLILAVKSNDIFATQLLLVFDADVNATNNSGLTPRHYAADICDKHKIQTPLPSAAHLILAMLNEMGAQRCADDSSSTMGSPIDQPQDRDGTQMSTGSHKCTDGCSCLGTYNGNTYNRWPDYEKESLYKRHMFADLVKNLRQQKSDIQASNRRNSDYDIRHSNLLCIDGGGMRGIIVCQIMIEMEKYLKNPMISYFDWVGGTSVGAFLACALCNGTSLRELRRISFDVKDEVFSGNKPYNSKFLERVLKRTLGTKTRMSAIKDKKLAVPTVIADRDPCQLRFFTNYPTVNSFLERGGYPPKTFNNMSGHAMMVQRHLVDTELANRSISSLKNASKSLTNVENYVLDENDQDPYLWQAVRASGAAPFFFKPYGPYLDGGIISNNPTMDILTEFHNYERAKSFLQARKVGENADLGPRLEILEEKQCKAGLVVSLGTGRGRVIGKQAMIDFGNVTSGFSTVFSPVELIRSIRAARDLFKKLMQQSCHTEDHILDRAQAWCSSLSIPYFRINPPLMAIFSIDDKRDEQLINALWQTKLYMRQMSPQLEELRELLDGPKDNDQDMC